MANSTKPDLFETDGAPPRTLTEHEVAKLIGVNVKTLRNWRVRGLGPKYLKYHNKLVRYRLAEIISWQESNLRRSTSDWDETHSGGRR